MRVGAIDIGTNTALLLIADVSGAELRPVIDLERFVRLGDGVDAAGTISPEAEARLLVTMSEYRAEIDCNDVDAVDVVATSAFRDARNRQVVARRIEESTGLQMRAISGETEAELTFLGGMSRLPRAHGRFLTLDIGGGSTELTAGVIDEAGARIASGVSTPCGAIRIRERFFPTVPPTADQVGQASRFIDTQFAAARHQMQSDVIIGTSGTTCALATLEYGHRSCEPEGAVRGASLTREQVRGWLERLMTLDVAAVLALNPDVMSGREDVFGAGVLVLDRAMEATGAARLIVSDGGLRHGVALRLAGV